MLFFLGEIFLEPYNLEKAKLFILLFCIMSMLNNLLRDMTASIVGKGNEQIADFLNSSKPVNEFNIAKSMEITINQARNLLYKISDYGLVSSVRKKDKKKGWYTYSWKFEILKCLEFIKKDLQERKAQILAEIKLREEKQFYVCEYCNLEYSEDDALLMDFTCDECGELFTLKDNTNLIKTFNKNLLKIEDILVDVDSEIEKEMSKIDKKKKVSLRKEQLEVLKKKEEAKKRREEKRKQRLLEKKKEEPKNKKVPKKTEAKSKKVVKKVKAKSVKKATKKIVSKKKPVEKKKISKKSTKDSAKKKVSIKKVSSKKGTKKK